MFWNYITFLYNFRMRKKWFTLIEVIIVLSIFFVLISIIFGAYSRLVRTKYSIQAKQSLIQSSYYMLEKLNIELKNYTVDYEEYFNRKMVGCDGANYWDAFEWNVNSWVQNWNCDNFTSFGNKNSILAWNKNIARLFSCSSESWYNTPDLVIQDNSIQDGSWCFNIWVFDYNSWFQQSFGQYKQQFWDYKDDSGKWVWVVWDDDDEDVWMWPIAIWDAQNIKELYLISQDGTKRIMFRRKLVQSGDRNKDGVVSWDSEYWYNLQMLRLRWFDAWNTHSFDDSIAEWIYDGKVDTWACDYAGWFVCNGSGVWWAYSWFNLPLNNSDGRVNMFEKNLTISNFNIVISPDKNPQYTWREPDKQINPFITLTVESKLYGQIRYKKLWIWSLDDFQLSLQTTFDTKNFYWK